MQSGEFLDSCILLGVNSSYTVSEDDLVYLEIVNEVSSPHIKESIDRSVPQNPVEESTKEFTLELQVFMIVPLFFIYLLTAYSSNGKTVDFRWCSAI